MGALLNDDKIPFVVAELNWLVYVGNPSTGIGGKTELGALQALLATAVTPPVYSFASIAAMLANLTIPSGFYAFVLDATDDALIGEAAWAVYFYNGGSRSDIASYKRIASEIPLNNQWIDCGNTALAGGLFPTTGGTGVAGGVRKNNTFVSTVAVTIDTVIIDVDCILIARVNNPGQTGTNWRVIY